jgi:hypothetical protein
MQKSMTLDQSVIFGELQGLKTMIEEHSSVLQAKVRGHSEKPPEVRILIEHILPGLATALLATALLYLTSYCRRNSDKSIDPSEEGFIHG